MIKVITVRSHRIFRSIFECRLITTKISADGKDIPKKKNVVNRITLIGADDSMVITDLKNAQNLSTRRDLKLVKIQDTDSKTRRPVYKLMTNAQYHEEELTRRKEKQTVKLNSVIKGDKLVTLSSKIEEHDVMTRVKKIAKLLEKQYEVKVVISGEDSEEMTKSERIYTIIEANLKSAGKIVQKRVSGNALRFQLLPLRESSSDSNNAQGSSQNGNEKGPL